MRDNLGGLMKLEEKDGFIIIMSMKNIKKWMKINFLIGLNQDEKMT
jgi:hypothetical protein